MTSTFIAGCKQPETTSSTAPATEEHRTAAEVPAAPRAEKRHHEVSAPAGTRNDPWYWLRDDEREDPDVIAYLEAENVYSRARMEHTENSQDRLYDEMRGRIREDESTAPYLHRGYWYYTRFEEGREYPVHARRRGDMEAEEAILLDVNEMAEGHAFFRVGQHVVSPDQRRVAWLEDTVGRRQFRLKIKDLETGEVVDTGIERVSSVAWAADNKTLFYVENHPETLLSYRVWRHELGAESEDTLVYEEQDPSFYTFVGTTTSQAYVMIYLHSTVSTEIRYLPADNPGGEFRVFLPRERDHEYTAEHLGERWIIHTNWDAPNFRVMEVNVGEEHDRANWRDVVPHDDGVLIHDFAAFHDFLAIDERSEGLRRIRITDWDGGDGWFIDSDESAYTASLEVNPDQTRHTLRYTYTSMTTPTSVYEVDIDTRERKLLKQQEIPGGYAPEEYATRRLWAEARDGERIPISVLYRRDTPIDGSAPLYQYAYGSYGASMDPTFYPTRFSLVDRGFVFAIAHIRGGQEMGRRWYDDGKLLHKKNTFTDFVDATDFLVREGYANPERVYAMGGSAGGLLMGAVMNMAPEKYHGIISHVPFVDVVTTMLDESIPLTTNEFDEWGNPEEPEYYEYMLSYSPYDNIEAKDYPNLLITTGLWDSQVQYWEPAKLVAKLRDMKTDDNLLLFDINMEAGHGGRSGRFAQLKETALEYAFVLDLAGVDS